MNGQERTQGRTRRGATTVCAMLATLLLGAGLSALTGCGAEESAELGTSSASLTVTPTFRVLGADSVGDEVFLQDLYLGVGEIRLEPLGETEEVVYVTRSPLHLHFDLAADQWELEGLPLQLPHGGEYLISIELTPPGEGELTSRHSVRLDGLFARHAAMPVEMGVNSANEPMPLPWRNPEDDEDKNADCTTSSPLTRRVEWVPWMYATQRPVHILLNDVHFSDTESDQNLVISLDLSSWLEEAFAPIQVAVESVEGEKLDPTSGSDSSAAERVEPVDVSRDLDRLGAGVEELDGFSEARAEGR